MSTLPKADPAIYQVLRSKVFHGPIPNALDGGVHLVLMDWNVSNGTATVLAARDGSASVYLSSGGGFIGGGQGHPEIRQAALQSINIATGLLSAFSSAEDTTLPVQGSVNFFIRKDQGTFRAIALEEELRAGKSQLSPLGGAMQNIITLYRLKYPRSSQKR